MAFMYVIKQYGTAVAQSPILGTTIPIERLKMKGYVSLSEYYKKLSIIIEPPYTRPPRTVVEPMLKLQRKHVRGAVCTIMGSHLLH
jgi:hypothetical protein